MKAKSDDFDLNQYARKQSSSDGDFDLNSYARKKEELPTTSNEEELPDEGRNIPRSIAIGFGKLGHRVLNAPHESVKLLEERLKQLGLPFKNAGFNQMAEMNQGAPLSSYIPKQQDYNFAEMLGQKGPGTLADKLIQGGIEYSPEILSLPGAVKALATKAPRLKGLMDFKKLGREQESLGAGIENAESMVNQAKEAESLAGEEANQLKEQGNKEIGTYLNKGAAHDVRAAQSLKHRMNNIEKYWSSSYKDLRSNLKNNNFQMEDLPSYDVDMQHVLEQLRKGIDPTKINAGINPEIKYILEKAPTSKDVSASDFLTKYQSFRDARYDLLQRAKNEKDASVRKELFNAYEKTKPAEEAVSTALENGLGEHAPEFKRINEGYSKQIYPLRGNSVIKKAMEGKLGPNILNDVAGASEDQELVRNLIKQDPELMRNVIGQRYAETPQKLHDLNDKSAEFIAEMPELQKLIDESEQHFKSKLSEVGKHKASKEINLKEKIRLEKESKELKDKIDRIQKDRNSIKKWAKRAGTTGAAFFLGKNYINNFINGNPSNK